MCSRVLAAFNTALGPGEGGGNENETPTARDFRDHQAAVYNRCEDVLCAVPPPALRTRMRGRDGFGADVQILDHLTAVKLLKLSALLFPRRHVAL
jgi:hypothetical protein